MPERFVNFPAHEKGRRAFDLLLEVRPGDVVPARPPNTKQAQVSTGAHANLPDLRPSLVTIS